MAGISISLEKLIRNDNYVSNVVGYLVTTFAVAGPWLITILVLTIFSSLYSYEIRSSTDYQLFNATIVYGFVGSQVLTVPFQFIVTRYIADELYRKRYDFLKPTLNGMIVIVFTISSLLSLFLFFNNELPLFYNILSSYFLIITSFVWVTSFFVSALGDYIFLGKSFIVGSLVGFFVFFLAKDFVNTSYNVTVLGLIIMVSSMTSIFLMLYMKFTTSIEEGNECKFDFLRAFSNYPSLFYIGSFYIFGLWIDKFIMWRSMISINVSNVLSVAPPYDQASFLANLLIIPSNVLFLTLIESGFIDIYKDYFSRISSGTYNEIEKSRKVMKNYLLKKLLQIFISQMVVVLLVFAYTLNKARYLKYDILTITIFKNMLIGILFYTIILIGTIMFLYYEERLKALVTSISFFILNLLLTLLYVDKSYNSYGRGFSLASFVVSIYVIYSVIKMLNNINYKIFGTSTRILRKKRKFFVTITDKMRIAKGVELDE